NVRRYHNEKHNITNGAEFFEAIHSYEGVKGVQAYECSLIRNPEPTKVTFPKITFVNNYEFEQDGIRVHRAGNVGVGKLLKWPLLDTPKAIGHLQCQPCPSKLQLSSITGVPKERKSLSDRSSITTTTTIELAVQASRSKLYDCPEEGCVASFIRYGNLTQHLCTGKHRHRRERSSMRDMGMTMYHSKLENIEVRSMFSLQLEETTPGDDDDTIRITPPDRGWALPKERKVTHLNESQVKYLTEKFDEGIQQRIRWKPEEVSAEMQRKKDLNNRFYSIPAEFLKTGQVRSFFSRLKSIRGKQTETVVADEGEEEDDEEFDDNNQVVEEIEQRNNLRYSMGISGE
ncbi:unnamed protein product, partial [Didymodactylos carnosus]